ncbi:pyridoxamine 5'-phosphate oxidase [Dokdonia sp. 4H-3-7-5]|jgi:pyridoxamine 5'-phosphate oxidase|uniref:pyridoxamine 5'-phosphate oxidase n=1 Tax=Dokdonia sp. (strain 4H-3-7-5) TaxID=983548 RepID=UPI00020A735D|nr:pyridoxamine 5'-phosphate oxidase [Dokdonia sp. 4H-3-7-5]AEE20833.1 pyridoxamine 5'-phosphate oxidase [Dokdonia sp. 4H-3-7-5]
MNRDLHDYRKSYEKGELLLENSALNPMDQFKTWFKEVEDAGGVAEPNAMTVATLGTDGFPKSRIVLLKELDADGFVFYTNYTSEKGESIAHHNKVGISFFWPNLERQVIIKGDIEKVSTERSDTYFNARPKDSQLGAWVSDQSSVIAGREVLEDKMKALKVTYEGKDIPRPAHWGGYIVKPVSIEFWQGRPSRLHDRIRYRLENDQWIKERLAS